MRLAATTRSHLAIRRHSRGQRQQPPPQAVLDCWRAAAAAGQAAAEIELPREASLGTFPIGITPERFQETMESKAVQREIDSLQKKFGDRKARAIRIAIIIRNSAQLFWPRNSLTRPLLSSAQVLLGIDRLDPIKGIPHKLLAFARLLETHPEYIGKVVLVQITVPSRLDVPLHQQLRQRLHTLVGQINGRYGSLDNVPIHYLDTTVAFEQMVALYAMSTAMVITSLRDGMNLVSFEWVVCQQYKRGFPLGGDPGATDTARVDENNPGSNAGVLILSEFAVGRAQFWRRAIIQAQFGAIL